MAESDGYSRRDGRMLSDTTRETERTWSRFLDYGSILLVLFFIVLFFSLQSRYFLTRMTFTSIANQIPALTVMAVGMTYVLIIAEIDLSVGSVMALSGAIISAAMVDGNFPLLPAVLLGIVSGILCGLLNGVVVSRWRVPSFIVTLGMLEMARGTAYLVTDSRTKYIGSSIESVSSPIIGGISFACITAVCTVIVGQLILRHTVFGRLLVGIGTREKTMQLVGIRTNPTKVLVFALSGFLASIASVFHTSRLQAADPNAGAGMELQVIAAVIIGGTSPLGGRGSVIRSFIGVLIISILEYGLSQIGVSNPFRSIVTGAFIIVAVVADMYRKRLRE